MIIIIIMSTTDRHGIQMKMRMKIKTNLVVKAQSTTFPGLCKSVPYRSQQAHRETGVLTCFGCGRPGWRGRVNKVPSRSIRSRPCMLHTSPLATLIHVFHINICNDLRIFILLPFINNIIINPLFIVPIIFTFTTVIVQPTGCKSLPPPRPGAISAERGRSWLVSNLSAARCF